ncbi:MAG: hypothetical protein HKN85_09660 [Gammaproteobacteria bacterium]|nr:hypothetical protein [Gammaproteobacteria bacterium]
MRISRRVFLTELVVAPLLWADISHAAYRDRLSISSLKISVPVWLFNDQGNNSGKARARSITVDGKADELLVSFTGKRELRLSPGTSVRSLRQGNSDPLTRKSILLKRIMAYGLDAIYRSIANQRHPERGINLAAEFAALQHQAVIEAISIGAFCQLIVKVNQQEMITSVIWNSASGEFVVV